MGTMKVDQEDWKKLPGGYQLIQTKVKRYKQFYLCFQYLNKYSMHRLLKTFNSFI